MGCRSVHATQVERSHLQQKSRPTLETSESESSRWNTEANHLPWLPQFRWVGVTTHKKDQRVVILVTHQPTVLCFAHIWGTESDTDGQTKRPGTQQQWSGMPGMPRCYARLPREGLWQDPLAASCRWARQFKATHCSMFWKGHTEEIAHCGCPVAMLGWNCTKSIIVHAKSKRSIKENQAR